MNADIKIPHDQIVLAFISTCIEATARKLGVSYHDVFILMLIALSKGNSPVYRRRTGKVMVFDLTDCV
mgnify:CR=1 FL=1